MNDIYTGLIPLKFKFKFKSIDSTYFTAFIWKV